MEQDQLIAAIVADPDDETAWLVYADWLLEREHPRGELIQLGPLAKAGHNEARWQIQRLELDEDSLLSPRLAARGKQWRFGFDRGFIRLAEFQTHGETPDAESISALCADSHAGLLEILVLEALEYRGSCGSRQRVDSRLDVGDLDRELASLRWLRRVTLHGVACNELTHPGLVQFQTDSIACANARIDLPALETLVWRAIGHDAGFGTLLRGPLPKLRAISVQRGYSGLVAELAEHPVAGQLDSFSIFTDDLAVLRLLVTHAGAFPGLNEIHIEGLYEELGQAEVDSLRGALERAYPGVTIYVPWRHLMPQPPRRREPRPDPPRVDAQSRRADGTIDAIARWIRRD